ncbi:MAG: hypothetical protein HUJ51_05025 [Eggerthellaceae bacterium]|nr:hypothetical protein [Eggerthellaceae bacterium]
MILFIFRISKENNAHNYKQRAKQLHLIDLFKKISAPQISPHATVIPLLAKDTASAMRFKICCQPIA